MTYATGGIFLIPKDYHITFGCNDGCIRVIPKGMQEEDYRLVINQEPVNIDALKEAVRKALIMENK